MAVSAPRAPPPGNIALISRGDCSFAIKASNAMAYRVLQYAMNTKDINGRCGKSNFRPDFWGDQAVQ
jgi:hypothetical protein